MPEKRKPNLGSIGKVGKAKHAEKVMLAKLVY